MPPMSLPNMSPKPIIQKTREPKDMSMMFFMTMFAAFLALVNPVSTMAKPGCIENTRKAPMSTQMVSTEENFSIFKSPYIKKSIKREVYPVRDTPLCVQVKAVRQSFTPNSRSPYVG